MHALQRKKLQHVLKDSFDEDDLDFVCDEHEGESSDVGNDEAIANDDEIGQSALDDLDFFDVSESLVRVLRLVDREQNPMGFIYVAMDRAKESIQNSYIGDIVRYGPFWEIIDWRWNNQLHQPIHATVYYLNPNAVNATRICLRPFTRSNRLSQKWLNDLVFVQYNLRLFIRKVEATSEELIDLDEIDAYKWTRREEENPAFTEDEIVFFEREAMEGEALTRLRGDIGLDDIFGGLLLNSLKNVADNVSSEIMSSSNLLWSCLWWVGATRKVVAVAKGQRCLEENTLILEELIQLRYKMARLLGYSDYAGYALATQMARTPFKVMEFLEDISRIMSESAMKELQMLKALKREEEGESLFGMEDLQYYMRKAEELELGIDYEELRHYFPVDSVTEGLLKIYQDLLGLKFDRVQGAEVWHPDVFLYSVLDSGSNELLAYFYIDLYLRDGKYAQTCVFPLQDGCLLKNGTRQ
ncbi:hypothetical protein KI387_013034, partial [Taxus chinensis]